MASNCPHGSGLLKKQEAIKHVAHSTADGELNQPAPGGAIPPLAEPFEAPDWMKSYGMPLAISCSVGYSLVGLVMVEPAADMLFHPAAILLLAGFAIGFVKGMQWWTTANESGKAMVCPHCGSRTRQDALNRATHLQVCRCGQYFSTM